MGPLKLELIEITTKVAKQIPVGVVDSFLFTGKLLAGTLLGGGGGEDSDSEGEDSFKPLCNKPNELIEEYVEENVDNCKPLERVFGSSIGKIMKDQIRKPVKEESECNSLSLLSRLMLTDDQEERNLLEMCGYICYQCCCETVNHLSPIIADATINLLSD